jgi:hypothetical protein
MSSSPEPELQFRLLGLSKQTLIAQACQFHNRREKAKAALLDDLYAEVKLVQAQAHPRVLERLCVSYLQQVCEKQHPRITELRGDPEQFDSYSQLKSQMLKAIAERHPWLAHECERQSFI